MAGPQDKKQKTFEGKRFRYLRNFQILSMCRYLSLLLADLFPLLALEPIEVTKLGGSGSLQTRLSTFAVFLPHHEPQSSFQSAYKNQGYPFGTKIKINSKPGLPYWWSVINVAFHVLVLDGRSLNQIIMLSWTNPVLDSDFNVNLCRHLNEPLGLPRKNLIFMSQALPLLIHLASLKLPRIHFRGMKRSYDALWCLKLRRINLLYLAFSKRWKECVILTKLGLWLVFKQLTKKLNEKITLKSLDLMKTWLWLELFIPCK